MSTNNENLINQLNHDIAYYKNNLDVSHPYGRSANGRARTSYKKTIKRLENDQQLAILKERNISN